MFIHGRDRTFAIIYVHLAESPIQFSMIINWTWVPIIDYLRSPRRMIWKLINKRSFHLMYSQCNIEYSLCAIAFVSYFVVHVLPNLSRRSALYWLRIYSWKPLFRVDILVYENMIFFSNKYIYWPMRPTPQLRISDMFFIICLQRSHQIIQILIIQITSEYRV